MKRLFLNLLFLFLMCFLSYQLGKSHTKEKIIEKQVEVIRYEKQSIQKAFIAPHPSRDTLLNLMRQNKF